MNSCHIINSEFVKNQNVFQISIVFEKSKCLSNIRFFCQKSSYTNYLPLSIFNHTKFNFANELLPTGRWRFWIRKWIINKLRFSIYKFISNRLGANHARVARFLYNCQSWKMVKSCKNRTFAFWGKYQSCKKSLKIEIIVKLPILCTLQIIKKILNIESTSLGKPNFLNQNFNHSRYLRYFSL